MRGLYDEVISKGKEAVDKASSNIIGQVRHLVLDIDWSQVSAYKYFDEKSRHIHNVNSDNEGDGTEAVKLVKTQFLFFRGGLL